MEDSQKQTGPSNTTQASFHRRCTDCSHSQNSPASNIFCQRIWRSNSFPGNRKQLLPISEPVKTHNTSLTKRWHSIPTVYLNTSGDVDSGHSRTKSYSNSSERILPALYSSTSQTPLAHRITCLFALGAFLALLLNFLQKQKRVTVFSPGIFGDVLNSAWWIPPTFGVAAIAIGLVYPKLDQIVGNHKKLRCEWSSVMRCIAMFVGINHASARIDFDSNVHLSLTLALLSLGLWYFFDQSLSGLGLGLLIAGIATAATQILVAMDVFGYSNPDFLYMQSWVPCLYFSGGVTIGACGRALAAFESDGMKHYHMD